MNSILKGLLSLIEVYVVWFIISAIIFIIEYTNSDKHEKDSNHKEDKPDGKSL